jgi:hypothetical protein
MSNTNELPTTDESKPIVCSSGCHSCGKGILRAAVYAPVVLIFGALAALAMFPDLADYGYPLIGNPSHTGFTGERPCSIILGNSSCSASVALPGSCSFSSNPSSSNSTESSGCCPMSRARQISSEANTESPATAEEVSGDFVTESTSIIEEIPADATLPLNLVDSEVPSN